MKRRMKNYLWISCDDVDLTTVTNIEFYLKQDGLFFQYTPEVLSASEMIVEIPVEDALKLSASDVKLQFAYTDESGTPRATEIERICVGDLLKEAGYDPI